MANTRLWLVGGALTRLGCDAGSGASGPASRVASCPAAAAAERAPTVAPPVAAPPEPALRFTVTGFADGAPGAGTAIISGSGVNSRMGATVEVESNL